MREEQTVLASKGLTWEQFYECYMVLDENIWLLLLDYVRTVDNVSECVNVLEDIPSTYQKQAERLFALAVSNQLVFNSYDLEAICDSVSQQTIAMYRQIHNLLDNDDFEDEVFMIDDLFDNCIQLLKEVLHILPDSPNHKANFFCDCASEATQEYIEDNLAEVQDAIFDIVASIRHITSHMEKKYPSLAHVQTMLEQDQQILNFVTIANDRKKIQTYLDAFISMKQAIAAECQ